MYDFQKKRCYVFTKAKICVAYSPVCALHGLHMKQIHTSCTNDASKYKRKERQKKNEKEKTGKP